MKKVFLIIALFFPLVVLIGWTGWLGTTRGLRQEVVLPIQGYDPRDLLSGHYLSYQIDWKRANCAQFEAGICPTDDFPKEMRFYVPEHQAKRLEQLIFQNDPMTVFEIVFAYNPYAQPIAKQMRINGFDWETYLRRYAPRKK